MAGLIGKDGHSGLRQPQEQNRRQDIPWARPCICGLVVIASPGSLSVDFGVRWGSVVGCSQHLQVCPGPWRVSWGDRKPAGEEGLVRQTIREGDFFGRGAEKAGSPKSALGQAAVQYIATSEEAWSFVPGIQRCAAMGKFCDIFEP